MLYPEVWQRCSSSTWAQSDVVREIRSHDVHVKEEHRCKVSGYSIDVLVTLNNGEQIAVEVDGPSHFLGRSHQPKGSALLKHRQLSYFGWCFESVPYWEWDAGICNLGAALIAKLKRGRA